ncbi:MAG: caspase family protein [Lewinellaceae bacterium]|nr:caspase family protein [Phaeodactylibacter sp.]MCB9040251.1 caspase family protein [Lewinellaceae bacterium]
MANGYAAHFGLNKLSASNYKSLPHPLPCCEADAEAMAGIAKRQGFKQVDTYLSAEATINTFNECMAQLAEKAMPGDLVLLSFSGHGGQVLDTDGDEDDGKDETWCFYDGQVVDDRIFDLLSHFQPGVRILVVSDSCHSGTVTRLPREGWGRNAFPFAPPTPTWRQKKDDLQASVLLLASCQDDETSKAGLKHSRFTQILLDVWDEGRFEGDYRKFLTDIRHRHPFGQKPNYYVIGAKDEGFEGGRVFGV